jgi:hypothetical protein
MAGLRLVDEELGVQALPHQPPLHVGEGDDDRVDLAMDDLRLQILEGQHPRDPTPLPELTVVIGDMS